MYNHYTEVPLPEATPTYTPVPHGDIITGLQGRMGDTSVSWRMSKNGQVLTGKVSMNTVGEFSPSVSFLNSYDKSKKLSLAGGLHTFVCSNGLVIGDIISLRKHTGKIDLGKYLDDIVNNTLRDYTKNVGKLTNLKYEVITPRDTARILGELVVEEGILNTTELNIIRKELKKPSFDYGSEGTRYVLYQHCTHALKNAGPSRMMASLGRLSDFFIRYY